MADIKAMISFLGSMEGMASNLYARGKVALAESKANKDANLAQAIKLTLALAKLAPVVNGAVKTILTETDTLKKTGKFEAYGKKVKTEAETLNKLASLAKQFSTVTSDVDILNALKTASIHFAGIVTYAEQYLGYYMKFAKHVNAVAKFKDTDNPEDNGKDTSLTDIHDFLREGARLEGICGAFISSARTAASEMKRAAKDTKATKGKHLLADYEATGKRIEALTKYADKAIAEFASMLKDLQKAEKAGSIDECVVKLRTRSEAFRAVHQNANQFATALGNAGFDYKGHTGLKGLMKDRAEFDEAYKKFKTAMP